MAIKAEQQMDHKANKNKRDIKECEKQILAEVEKDKIKDKNKSLKSEQIQNIDNKTDENEDHH